LSIVNGCEHALRRPLFSQAFVARRELLTTQHIGNAPFVGHGEVSRAAVLPFDDAAFAVTTATLLDMLLSLPRIWRAASVTSSHVGSVRTEIGKRSVARALLLLHIETIFV
jgi:hypothetical protein